MRESFLHSHTELSEATRIRALEILASDASSYARLQTGGASLVGPHEPDPEQIGDYRVLRLIGRGGMGNVYLAEKMVEDFDHTVAIKVIKQRLTTQQIVDRFRSERQILADLNHPNIARFFDGGETQAGTPYFVMEFVDGVPLDVWLKRETPSLERRLAIFVQICSAVQAAHQRLIVHRDLTPPNILVTAHDAAKVIDFGIARPEQLHSEGLPLPFEHTPGFAAPEQMAGAATSTLADMFALGQLLRLISLDFADAEVDSIAAKAVAEDPIDRYPSVSALVTDVEHYRADRPVSAMSGGAFYSAKKLVKRQTLAVALGGIVLAVSVGALLLISNAYREAEAARATAQARLADTRQLASTMMFDVFDEMSKRQSNAQARLMLASNAQQYLEELATNPEATFADRLAAARGFARLAEATGTYGAANAGDIPQGIRFRERSIEILEELFREAPNDDIALLLGRAHVDLARDLLISFLDLPGVVEHAEKAVDTLLSIQNHGLEALAELGRAERYLADGLACCNDRVEEGIAVIARGLERQERASAVMRQDPLVQRAYNDLLHINGGFEIFLNGDDAGIPFFRRALVSQRALAEETNAPEDHHLEAMIAFNLSATLVRMGEVSDAAQVLRPTYARTLQAYEADPEDNDLQRRLARTTLTMAHIMAEEGSRNEAARLVQTGIALARESERISGHPDGPSPTLAARLQEAAQALWANGKVEEACQIVAEAVGIYEAYAERYQLPETTMRYRLAPLRTRAADC
ncbi:MAG: serine/threonine-protein kinase [Pseudomonadota bacterium]